MYSVPLGSPTVSSKRSYVHVPRCSSQGEVVGVQWCAGPCGTLSTGTGWVYRRGNTGYYQPTRSPREEQTLTAKRARKPLQGAGVVVRVQRARVPRPTLRARSVSLQDPSLVWVPAFQSNGRANQQNLRKQLNNTKVSQNREVSPKYL